MADTSNRHPFYIPLDVDSVTEAHHPDSMVAALAGGRLFSIHRRPLLSDCAPSGRVRLDALARWMQDVAFADLEEAGLEQVAVWVLRRHRIHVNCFPRFGQRCEVHTFCSGIGRMWAERRTTVTLAGPPAEGEHAVSRGAALPSLAGSPPLVEAVALWVHLDPVRRMPSLVTPGERAVYAAAAGDRRVPTRLRHPRPETIEREWLWSFRHTDSDLADHVNNAAYWEPLEDELLGAAPPLEPTTLDAEIEFRAAAQPGPKRILASGPHRWLTDPGGGEIYASTALRAGR